MSSQHIEHHKQYWVRGIWWSFDGEQMPEAKTRRLRIHKKIQRTPLISLCSLAKTIQIDTQPTNPKTLAPTKNSGTKQPVGTNLAWFSEEMNEWIKNARGHNNAVVTPGDNTQKDKVEE